MRQGVNGDKIMGLMTSHRAIDARESRHAREGWEEYGVSLLRYWIDAGRTDALKAAWDARKEENREAWEVYYRITDAGGHANRPAEVVYWDGSPEKAQLCALQMEIEKDCEQLVAQVAEDFALYQKELLAIEQAAQERAHHEALLRADFAFWGGSEKALEWGFTPESHPEFFPSREAACVEGVTAEHDAEALKAARKAAKAAEKAAKVAAKKGKI